MPDYTFCYYIYFNNMTHQPNKNHNHFILNQKPDFHTTSPFKLMNDIFELLPKLFGDQMLKKTD